MISEIKPSELPLNLNTEINDLLDKTWSKNPQSSKEQQDKLRHEIYQYFLQRLSAKLNDSNPNEITDLIVDKSVHISEVLSSYEWPSAETLKVPNLHRFALPFYNYVKSRVSLLIIKSKKNNKENAIKASDNLLKMLNNLIDNPILSHLENTLLYIIFKDLFTFYAMSGYNPETKEEIDNIIDLYREETNIGGLSKMKSIDKSAEMNLFLGTLVTVLQFKIDLAEKKEDISIETLENISKHQDTLRSLCYLENAEMLWLLSCYKFINEKDDISLFKQLKEMIDIGKIYSNFIKSTSSKLYDIIANMINLLRTLMLIIIVDKNVKLTENVLSALMYEQYEMDSIMNASYNNLSPIKKIFKNGMNGIYHELKFAKTILTLLQKKSAERDIDTVKSTEYRNIVLGFSVDSKEEEFFTNEKYLRNLKEEENKKYDSLLEELNKK